MARMLNTFFLAALLIVPPRVTYSDDNADAPRDSDTASLCEKLAADEELVNGEREDYLSVCRDTVRICAAAAAKEGIDELDYYPYLRECVYNFYMERDDDPEEDVTVMEGLHGDTAVVAQY